MPWYRRKREDVEAWQLTHENYDDGEQWPDWIMDVWQLDREHHFQSLVRSEYGARGLALYTRDERAMVRVGDYITRDPAGHLTHVAGAAFEATHTAIEAEAPPPTTQAIEAAAIERAAKVATTEKLTTTLRERASYLRAMAPEGLSVIERQSMDAMETAASEIDRLTDGIRCAFVNLPRPDGAPHVPGLLRHLLIGGTVNEHNAAIRALTPSPDMPGRVEMLASDPEYARFDLQPSEECKGRLAQKPSAVPVDVALGSEGSPDPGDERTVLDEFERRHRAALSAISGDR